jgi:uncharacterized protein YegJ (DUF2314 family)
VYHSHLGWCLVHFYLSLYFLHHPHRLNFATELGKMNYQLVDVEERNKNNPDTFWIPSLEDRQDIDVGQWVKLGFKGKEITERMWVKVTNIVGSLVGTLDNDPAVLPIAHGDSIDFEPKHIMEILDNDDEWSPV